MGRLARSWDTRRSPRSRPVIEEKRTIRRRRDEVKTMKTLKTLKDKREGLPEEEERDGSRPDMENKVKAKPKRKLHPC